MIKYTTISVKKNTLKLLENFKFNNKVKSMDFVIIILLKNCRKRIIR